MGNFSVEEPWLRTESVRREAESGVTAGRSVEVHPVGGL